jgi:Family of unknown function (DUF6152)
MVLYQFDKTDFRDILSISYGGEFMKKSIVLLATLVMGPALLFAHHGTGSSYDMNKVVVLKGVITQFAFANPHSQLYFDVTDDQGNVQHWSAEMRNPRNLEAEGHTRKELTSKLAPGVKVEVTGNPSKAGTPVLVLGKALREDGWCLCKQAGSDAPGVVGTLR